MDSQHTGGGQMEPDWAALIRRELDAHSPRRLPSRFTPPQLPEAPAGRRWVRPLAAALAVLLVAGAVLTAVAATQPGGIVGTNTLTPKGRSVSRRVSSMRAASSATVI